MQISDDLIKHITRELMKRLQNGSVTADQAERPLLHLVGRTTDLSTPALARLQDNFEIQEHLNWDDSLPPAASALITRLNIQALVRVAEGDEGCTVEGRVLLAALLNGQPVAALKDGLIWRNYVQTAPKALLNRYGQCENILTGYGLKIVGEMEAVEALLPCSRTPAAPEQRWSSTASGPISGQNFSSRRSGGGGRVLAESDLKAACPFSGGPGQTLKLEPGDIMTPLAQDYARTMQINIVNSQGTAC